MKIAVIPDTQVKPGQDYTFLNKLGHYLVEKQPDVIVQIGDWADMESLSTYDIGKRSFEGRRYKADIEASHEAMDALLEPLWTFNQKAKKNKEKQYKPRMVLTLGNHEARINRAVEDDPKLEGMLSIDDLRYKEYGWEVHGFLDVVIIENVAFSHYFVTGVAGRPASTAAAQLRKTNMSSVAGHQQGKQIAYATRADGTTITSIISGSCYLHDEAYMGAQGNKQHYRGFLMMHDVKDGAFDEMWVSLAYLDKKYEE